MDLILPIIFATTPTDGSCYRVINLSNIQKVFSSVSKFSSCKEEKTLELKKIMTINNILNVSNFCVMRLTQNQNNQ